MPKAQWTIDAPLLEKACSIAAEFSLHSPLLPAPWLGPRTWLKLELDQPTGSFKVRGGCVKVASLSKEEKAAGLVAASAGNHGLGLAYAARAQGVSLDVLVPSTAPDVKIDKMRALGAKVEVCEEASYDEVERKARELADETGATFVSPFDDASVAAGNGGTLGVELLDALPNLRRIVVPCGGGGLLAGIAAACRLSDRSPQLVAVESEVSDALRQSLESGETVTALAPEGPTLAYGLEGGISETTHAVALEAGVLSHVVNEEEIALAMVFTRERLGRPIEGNAAVGVAWARKLEHQTESEEGDTVVVVTGGNVDAHILDALAAGWRPGESS